MNRSAFRFRQVADYGGTINASLCLLHCATGPLVLAWWGSQAFGAPANYWEVAFLGISGLFVALATWRQSTTRLRLTLWLLFSLSAASTLLAARWPWLETVQLVCSAGLIGGHLLNQRRGRCCGAGSLQKKAPRPAASR